MFISEEFGFLETTEIRCRSLDVGDTSESPERDEVDHFLIVQQRMLEFFFISNLIKGERMFLLKIFSFLFCLKIEILKIDLN